MKRQQPDEETLSQFIAEAAELEKWDVFAKSDFGLRFLKFLDEEIIKSVHDEDEFDVYSIPDSKILYQLAAIRSKRQFIRLLKNKMLTAGDKKKEIMEEVNKYKE